MSLSRNIWTQRGSPATSLGRFFPIRLLLLNADSTGVGQYGCTPFGVHIGYHLGFQAGDLLAVETEEGKAGQSPSKTDIFFGHGSRRSEFCEQFARGGFSCSLVKSSGLIPILEDLEPRDLKPHPSPQNIFDGAGVEKGDGVSVDQKTIFAGDQFYPVVVSDEIFGHVRRSRTESLESCEQLFSVQGIQTAVYVVEDRRARGESGHRPCQEKAFP